MKKFNFKELSKKIDSLKDVRLYEWAGICTGLTLFLVIIQALDLLKKQEVKYQDAVSFVFYTANVNYLFNYYSL